MAQEETYLNPNLDRTISLDSTLLANRKSRNMMAISPATNAVLNILMIIACLLTLIPIYVIVISSVTSEAALTKNGYRLWPEEFSTMAYTFLFSRGSIVITSYINTIISTLAGTVLAVAMVGLYAYAISRDNFKFKTFFTFYAFFTMLFSGGLVSYYMVTRQVLQIHNSLWALFLPSAFSPFWVIVMRTFYKANVPNEIIESARIDGASEWRTFLQIVLPLSVPGLATVALFSAIGIWNNFFNCLLLVDEARYYSLQFTIYTTLNNIRFLLENADKMVGLVNVSTLPSQTFRMAMAVVTVGPIIFAYPFFQRYFIRGLTIGAIKG
ncbi:MAG TPA: carbohydrate ABC transporter permease [Anaerolinea thermolimosa]|uniref:Carbohydrate ABC transporter permease n=1 Tax=Anaerolinea thermolimosa TaxID=229919 RepID=A0A3D1JD34_9CHLR|nr:carbohydrate ABC transporter permease [Anaerolinea thermolimosa]GAP08228.1 ABC-type sugar transport system, permease component [Anaerolinea thermolimosa]HCE16489.1 carbohydrate ABC transporter permease [Anaerolinea thermolimosa]